MQKTTSNRISLCIIGERGKSVPLIRALPATFVIDECFQRLQKIREGTNGDIAAERVVRVKKVA
jgi:hypothetical protein